MATRELYEVLGLQPFADSAMVDQAYWHLAKSFQTLGVTDPRARQALDDLNDAYGVLGTPRLREEYDVTLSRMDSATRSRSAAKPTRAAKRNKGFGLGTFFRRSPSAEEAPASGLAAAVEQVAAPALEASTSMRPARRSKQDVQQLQTSTEDMLRRWRANAGVGAETPLASSGAAPDNTLVDIFRSEQAAEDGEDPLNAVMNVLRTSRDTTPVR